MFRLVADITELNIDQVKLPKIPGLGMLMKLPNKQKISMIVSVLNAQKGQFLPKWQEAVNQKWGQLQLLDYQVEQPGDGSCLARIRIDVGNADYDKAIDSVIPHVFQEKDVHTVLGGDYAGSKPAGSDAIYAQCTDGGKEGILHCKDIKRGKGNNCKKL